MNSTIQNNGGSGGVVIVPTGGPIIDVVLDRVRLLSNSTGITANGLSGGSVHVQFTDSVVSGNAGAGISSTTGIQPTSVFAKRNMISGNGTGVLSDGSGSVVLLDGNTITGNGTALSSTGSGALFTYQNNSINDNGSPGTAATPVTLK